MSADQASITSINGQSPPANIPFSIVIPAYNEAKRLPASIRDLRSFFSGLVGSPDTNSSTSLAFEILIVVEKSNDDTLESARRAAADDSRIQVIDNQVQRGKGYAVKSGMLRARGELVFFMDADLSTPLAEVVVFLSHFSSHPETDVVIGNRAHVKSQILKKQSWLRRNLGRSFNQLVRLLGVQGIYDTQCGFKAFRSAACREIFSRQTIDGFAFDVEILLLAERLGFKTDVLPVRWINAPDSKVRILVDPFRMIWDLVRIRWIVQRTLQARPLSP
jgi:dolichyl-phosphate beta-glucosyltransferase